MTKYDVKDGGKRKKKVYRVIFHSMLSKLKILPAEPHEPSVVQLI